MTNDPWFRMAKNDQTSRWQLLLKAAMLGTERSTIDIALSDDALGQLLTRASGGSPQATLLSRAAVMATYQRAGRKPLRIAPPQETAQQTDIPRLGPKAGEFHARMLAGENRPLLPEFLEAVAKAQKRVPEESLPELLNLGRSSANLRPLILPVIGHRGHWLAAQNPEWNYISGEESSESVWQTGAASARLLMLGQLRKSDPGAARSMLEST